MGAETDKRSAKTEDGWTPETERLEQVEALPRNLRGDAKTSLDSIRKEINKAGQKAPEL